MRKYQHFKNVHILIHESGGEKTSIRLLLSFRKYEPKKKKREKYVATSSRTNRVLFNWARYFVAKIRMKSSMARH